MADVHNMMEKNDKRIPKPAWIRVKAPVSPEYKATRDVIHKLKLNTVCEEAACPNIGECWSQKHATVMIMGDTCTRACAFCNVKTGQPGQLNPHEPENLAQAVAELKLKHVVVTSVDRDDLEDGGAKHFADCIKAMRARAPDTTIEVLTPDFLRKEHGIPIVVAARPDVYNHNIETVPRLYKTIRPGARYFHSLYLLKRVKELANSSPHRGEAGRGASTGDMTSNISQASPHPNPPPAGEGVSPIFTKSGIMVGLGETKDEVLQVMDDLRSAEVDFMTIGQYLQPTPAHVPVDRFVTPDEFDYYGRQAKAKGFLMVSSSPLTRSSYHAAENFAELKKAREQQLVGK